MSYVSEQLEIIRKKNAHEPEFTFRTADDERVVSVTWLDADAGDDEELEEETGSEVLGESVSELDEALSDAVSDPDAAEDVE